MNAKGPLVSATGVEADPVPQFDEGPGRHRIGLVVLASDHVTERDFRAMTPTANLLYYTSRVQDTGSCNLTDLATMGPRLSEAADLLLPGGRLDALAYSCTSGAMVIGVDAVRASLTASRPGLPCATPITGALSGMARLGVSQIGMLSPYLEEVALPMRQYLEARGVEVVAFRALNLERELDLARLTPRAIHDAALRLDCPAAQALFIPCTGIRAVEVIESLERALDKPVLTSVQALFWESVRLAGYTAPIPGFGRLLLR